MKRFSEVSIHRSWQAMVILVLVFSLSLNVGAQEEDLSVLASWKRYEGAGSILYNALANEAYRYLDERDRKLDAIDTAVGWERYRAEVREKLSRAFGPVPEKTPLNVRSTGSFVHGGIQVEKIIYESRPGFLVTACVFKPVGRTGKLPTILYVSGHTEDGFRSAAYQNVILNLARKGFLVLAIDPVGQGERLQYYDADEGKSVIGGPTHEHSYASLPYLLIGRTMAMVRCWDAARGLDYLAQRPDVDTGRMGVHGRSGGGTMSSYIGAMDDRIAAAAPECFITSFRRLLQTIGPQDAEQNLNRQISLGLDEGDFLIARAPRPTLIVSTTRDIFSIQGTRETFRQILPSFEVPGGGTFLAMTESDAPHQSTRENRERVYEFFMKAFGVGGDSSETDIGLIDPKLLRVSATGQVMTSGSKTLYDYTVADAEPVLAGLAVSRERMEDHRNTVLAAARDYSGYRADTQAPTMVFTGRYQRDGYRIERVILDENSDLPLPALVFVPERGGPYPTILLVDQEGKSACSKPGGLAETLVKQGYLVCAVDVPGCGELRHRPYGMTGAGAHDEDSVIGGVSYNLIFFAQLIGRSITGIQAEALARCADYLASRSDVKSGEIAAVSIGITGPALMHAAVFDGNIRNVAFIGTPLSWETVIRHPLYDSGIGSTIVPGALNAYDLPDLLGMIQPRQTIVIDPIDGDGSSAPESLRRSCRAVVQLFCGEKTPRFTMVQSDEADMVEELLIRWLDE